LIPRIGIEFEWLAPVGFNRLHVAQFLAKELKGHVECGFKYFSERTLENGRPFCILSQAFRVHDSTGEVCFTLVDDNTIRDGLNSSPRVSNRATTDDLRVALLAERICWNRADTFEKVVGPLLKIFQGKIEKHKLLDPFGHPILVTEKEPKNFSRVCEVVTGVLKTLDERKKMVSLCFKAQKEFELLIPKTAAMHVHFDAKHWKSVKPLVNLVNAFSQNRTQWLQKLKPNKHCLKLGPLPELVQEVARKCPKKIHFETLCAAFKLAGAHKACDINILGVIEQFTKQPTLEVRCLPMPHNEQMALDAVQCVESLVLTSANA
jgi:hypothetical protein